MPPVVYRPPEGLHSTNPAPQNKTLLLHPRMTVSSLRISLKLLSSASSSQIPPFKRSGPFSDTGGCKTSHFSKPPLGFFLPFPQMTSQTISSICTMLERYKLSRGSVLRLLLDQGPSCSAWPSAREPTIWSRHGGLQDCRAFGEAMFALLARAQHPCILQALQERGVAMSPASTPPAASSAAGQPTPFFSRLMSYWFSRSKNSLGKFPEHKVSLRS